MLFVALVFLVLITLLGLTASSTSILQERMTGGLRNGQLGLMGAETAVRGAESWLWSLSSNNGHINCGYNGGENGFCYAPQTADDGSGGTTYASNPLVTAFRTSPTWIANASSGGTNYTNGTYAALNASSLGTAALAQIPQYLFESRGIVLPPGAPPNGQTGGQGRDNQGGRQAGNQTLFSYRITARATGGNEGAVAVVETTFGAGVPSN
ncbi:MAG: pilus assembly PilX family protein [Rudaea sp.]